MTNTRRLTLVATLSALSFVLMLFNFPIIPGVDFLKLDFSVLPILFGLVLLDLRSALTILILRTVIKLLLDNGGVGGMIGLPMNVIALGVFVISFALVWNRTKTAVRFIQAGILGTLLLTVSMIVLNLIYAVPLYAKFANFDIGATFGISKYIISMVLPFNILEGIILSVVFYVAYLACHPILERHKVTTV